MKTTSGQDATTRPERPCFICGGTPCLRIVGGRGYCKKHKQAAFDDRSKANQTWCEEIGQVPSPNHSRTSNLVAWNTQACIDRQKKRKAAKAGGQ